MEFAASIVGILGFADLLLKYTTISSVWKDAPPALRRIKESLASLSPILSELTELHNLSQDELLSQGLNIDAFKRDLKALDDIANDMLGPEAAPNLKLRKRTTWTLKHHEEATELGKRLDSHIGAFTFVLALVNRKSTEQLKEQFLSLESSEFSIQAAVVDLLEINRSVNTRLSVQVNKPKESATRLLYSPTVGYKKKVTDICARRAINKHQNYPCRCAEPGAPSSSYENCNCNNWGLVQVRYRNSTTMAPHSGRKLDSQYLIEADFTTWKTLLGQFRFILSVKARQQAWSLSFPSINLSKQNIVSIDAPVFKLAHRGDLKGIVELFRLGLASPNDRTIEGRTPLLYAANSNQLETLTGLIAEGADVNAVWTSSSDTESVLYHSVIYGKSDEISTLLLNHGADPFGGRDSPEVLFEKAMISAGNYGAASPPKRRTLMMLGNLLSHPKDLPTDKDIPSPFQLALKWGSLEGTQIALRAGYDVNAPLKWKTHLYEKAPRPTIPIIFAASRIHSRAVWHKSGPIEPNRGPILHELVRQGANLKLAEADTGSTVLHHVLSGCWWDSSYAGSNQSYVIFCQLVVFLINNGADPRAVDVHGQSPSDVVWDYREYEPATIQRRALVWYRSLRMCGLNPSDYDRRYDSRFDLSYRDCYFCAFDAGAAQEMDFVACPWCIGEPYGMRANWQRHDNWRYRSNVQHNYTSVDNLENLGPLTIKESELYQCCPMFACLWHYPRASSGVRLPRKPGRPMRPYAGLTPNSTSSREVVGMLRAWGVTGIADPDQIRYAEWPLDETDGEEEQEQGENSGKFYVSDEDEDEFYDALEEIKN